MAGDPPLPRWSGASGRPMTAEPMTPEDWRHEYEERADGFGLGCLRCDDGWVYDLAADCDQCGGPVPWGELTHPFGDDFACCLACALELER